MASNGMASNGTSHDEKPDEEPEKPQAIAWAGIFEKVKAEIRTGLVASVIAEAALFPLDVIKMQQQVRGGTASEVLRRVFKEHGAIGFYRGLFGRLIQTITSNVGFFIWQTIAVQWVAHRKALAPGEKLGTGLSLLVNMLAQQFNRLLTTPVDVVANVNQTDPKAQGFFLTFLHLARTGGRNALWRGLPVSMILSFNPALMFTLVDKLTALLKSLRKDDEGVGAKDMFWISGVSKAVATVVTYPLIRAKTVQQTMGGRGLWATLLEIAEKEGKGGLYAGVWMLSYKTVLFNSLMMALKQTLGNLENQWSAAANVATQEATRLKEAADGWRKHVVLAGGGNALPWEVAAKGGEVVYADGSWSFLHKAQEHLLQNAREYGQYLLVGVHSDKEHQEAIGSWPSECYAARMSRLRELDYVEGVLENAPWIVTHDLIKELGITKVVSGYPMSKCEDCSPPCSPVKGEVLVRPADPYEVPKELNCFYTIESLNKETEHEVWMARASRILFSNVDASIDWRILVKDGAKTSWGKNPGYTGQNPRKGSGSDGGRSREPSPDRARQGRRVTGP